MMKKNYLFIFIVFLTCSLPIMAQAKMTVQVGMAFPSGNFSKAASNGYGACGTVEFKQDDLLSLCAYIGYYTWGPYSEWYLGPTDSYSDFQVMLGIRYNFSHKDIHPYLEFDAGLNSLSYSHTIYYGYTGFTTQLSQGRIGLSPVMGMTFKINHQLNMDVNLRYNYTSQETFNGTILPTNFFAFNTGLQFSI